MEMGNQAIVDYGLFVPQGPTNDRIRKTVKFCVRQCIQHQVAFVFIEGIQIQRNPTVYEILAKLQGTLEIVLEEKGYFVNVVKASEWRRRAGIQARKRKLIKEEVMAMVKDVYDLEPTEDECEAIIFARAFALAEVKEE